MPREPDADEPALKAVLARAFPASASDPQIARTADGVSSMVYRVTYRVGTFYLRIADDSEDDLRADAEVLQRLLALGVAVPEVVYVEACAPELDRSVLVMREVPGTPLAVVRDESVARRVARQAGHDAAVINSVPVDGFAWIRRDRPRWPPVGEIASYHEFARAGIPEGLAERHCLLTGLFTVGELEALDELVHNERTRDLQRGSLAHGDLDVTAIYVNEGAYSGIIDFSELRGGEPEFDLGHFLLHDEETNPTTLFAAFYEGYCEVAQTEPDLAQVRRVAILLGLRQLCGWLRRDLPRSWLAEFRAAQLVNLLEHKPACAPRHR